MKNIFFALFLVFISINFTLGQEAENPASDSSAMLGQALYVPSPTNVNASDGTFEYYINIDWNKDHTKTKYRVFKNTSPEEANKQEVSLTKTKAIRNNFLFDYAVSPGVLYYYWIMAEDISGEKSIISSFDSGFIPKAAPIASITPFTPTEDLLSLDNINFEWSSVFNAQQYQLQITGQKNASWSTQDGYTSNEILVDTIIDNNAFVFSTPIETGTSLSWSVRAFNEQGSSYFSTPQEFSILERIDVLTTSQTVSSFRLHVSSDSFSPQKTEELTFQYSFEKDEIEGSEHIQVHAFHSTDRTFDNGDKLLDSVFIPAIENEEQTTSIKITQKIPSQTYILLIPKIKSTFLMDSVEVVEVKE